jgi:hypothetical protein
MIDEELIDNIQHARIVDAVQILLFAKSYIDNIPDSVILEQINLKAATQILIEKAIIKLNS